MPFIIIDSQPSPQLHQGDKSLYDLNFKMASLSVAFVISTIAACAKPLTFTPTGDSNFGMVKCEVPVTSLGSMPLKSGTATISGKVITIKAGSAYIDEPRTVLVGSVLRSEANLTSDPQNITGIALFLMGDWVDQINDPSTADVIFRKDGHVEGKILGIENDAVSVKMSNGTQQLISLSSILYIRSPRVFVFKIGLKTKVALQKDTVFQADSTDASFRPTSTARTLSGSVIPQSEKKDDGNGMAKLGGGSFDGMNGAGGLGGANGFGSMNQFGSPGALTGARTAVPNQNDSSFDNGDDAARFSTIKTKWGTQKMMIPPGILD